METTTEPIVESDIQDPSAGDEDSRVDGTYTEYTDDTPSEDDQVVPDTTAIPPLVIDETELTTSIVIEPTTTTVETTTPEKFTSNLATKLSPFSPACLEMETHLPFLLVVISPTLTTNPINLTGTGATVTPKIYVLTNTSGKFPLEPSKWIQRLVA